MPSYFGKSERQKMSRGWAYRMWFSTLRLETDCANINLEQNPISNCSTHGICIFIWGTNTELRGQQLLKNLAWSKFFKIYHTSLLVVCLLEFIWSSSYYHRKDIRTYSIYEPYECPLALDKLVPRSRTCSTIAFRTRCRFTNLLKFSGTDSTELPVRVIVKLT